MLLRDPKMPCVYLLASQRNGTLYCGVTSNVTQRLISHREKLRDGFTTRHDVNRLVWFEYHPDMLAAIAREKAIKKWHRAWKLTLIESANPLWRDLGVDMGLGPVADRRPPGSPLSRG